MRLTRGPAVGRAGAAVQVLLVVAGVLGWGPEPSPPPAPSPASPPLVDLSSPAAQAFFAVACGLLGLIFVFIGQRVWRVFLASSALAVAGGLTFYLLVRGAPDLPLWGDGVIASCVGIVTAGMATFFALVGLLIFSGAAGMLVAWSVLRASGLAGTLDERTPRAHLMVACGCAALTMIAVLVCQCGGCCAGRRRRASLTRSRRSGWAKLGEALITSVIGAYGVLFCVDHWLAAESQGLSPADIVSAEPPAECTTACAALLGSFAALAALGFVSQALCIRGQQRGRQLEEDALRQPLDLGPPRRDSRGRETALASRIRMKYFRRGTRPTSPVNEASRQDLDLYLTNAADRRQTQRAAGRLEGPR